MKKLIQSTLYTLLLCAASTIVLSMDDADALTTEVNATPRSEHLISHEKMNEFEKAHQDARRGDRDYVPKKEQPEETTSPTPKTKIELTGDNGKTGDFFRRTFSFGKSFVNEIIKQSLNGNMNAIAKFDDAFITRYQSYTNAEKEEILANLETSRNTQENALEAKIENKETDAATRKTLKAKLKNLRKNLTAILDKLESIYTKIPEKLQSKLSSIEEYDIIRMYLQLKTTDHRNRFIENLESLAESDKSPEEIVKAAIDDTKFEIEQNQKWKNRTKWSQAKDWFNRFYDQKTITQALTGNDTALKELQIKIDRLKKNAKNNPKIQKMEAVAIKEIASQFKKIHDDTKTQDSAKRILLKHALKVIRILGNDATKIEVNGNNVVITTGDVKATHYTDDNDLISPDSKSTKESTTTELTSNQEKSTPKQEELTQQIGDSLFGSPSNTSSTTNDNDGKLLSPTKKSTMTELTPNQEELTQQAGDSVFGPSSTSSRNEDFENLFAKFAA